jgi:hypothetical protein
MHYKAEAEKLMDPASDLFCQLLLAVHHRQMSVTSISQLTSLLYYTIKEQRALLPGFSGHEFTL